MSWWFAGSIGCALAAGALLPRAPGRGLDRLSQSGGKARVAERGTARCVAAARWHERVGKAMFRARVAEQTRAGLVELADALSAELRAGAQPREALWRAARDEPRFAELAAVTRSPGGDVVSMLNELASLPGGAAARDLATAWVVCETSGGRLAAPVARLAGGWRDEEQVRREVRAQLAGPRATAVLLAGLPFVGIAMGVALGADPLALMRQPSFALAVLVPGLLLEAAGLLWTARITRRAGTW